MLLLVGILAPAVMAGLGFALAYMLRGNAIHLTRWPAPKALGAGAFVALVSMGLISGLYRVNKSLERALKETGTRIGLEALRTAGYPVMLVLVATAGFGEEILFRGGLQPTIGIIPAAVLFGFSHGGWRREMLPYVLAATMSGAMFGLVYRLTGDLWAPVTAHVVHNLLSTILLGKTFEWSRKGRFPMVRLVPEPLDDLLEAPAWAGEQAAADLPAEPDQPTEVDLPAEPPEMEGSSYDTVDEPLPAAADRQANGSDVGNPPAGNKE
jgi:membrane protease YdiL (CAAX protease family)